MPKSRHSEEQIIRVLRQVEQGAKVDVCWEHGIAKQTYYRSRYGGLGVSKSCRLKERETESRPAQ